MPLKPERPSVDEVVQNVRRRILDDRDEEFPLYDLETNAPEQAAEPPPTRRKRRQGKRREGAA